MDEFRQADAVEVGDWILRDPWAGKVEEIREHGRIGDGSIDWLTFRVREMAAEGVPKHFTEAVGPLRADEQVKIIFRSQAVLISHLNRVTW